MGIAKKKMNTSQLIIIAICLLICLITVYPMYYVLVISISDPVEVSKGGIYFFPKGFSFRSYKIISSDLRLWRSVLNSIFYVVASTTLMLITSSLGAYPLTCKNLLGRKYIVAFLLIPMYFGGGMIPSFLLIYKLGIYNTVWALILPGAVGIMNIILMRTYLMTIPFEVAESAFMDGARHFTVMSKIYVPLAKPVLAVIAIYTIVGVWNSWFGAMVYLPNERLHPVQMYLQRILIANTVDLTKLETMEEVEKALGEMMVASQLKYTMIIFVTLPIIMVYPMFQKHFIKGVMLGSLKA